MASCEDHSTSTGNALRVGTECVIRTDEYVVEFHTVRLIDLRYVVRRVETRIEIFTFILEIDVRIGTEFGARSVINRNGGSAYLAGTAEVCLPLKA